MLKKFSLFIIVFFLANSSLSAQLSSETYDFKTVSSYSNHDSIFVFYQSPGSKTGSLTASTPKKVNADYIWSAYDTINKVFQSPFKTETNVTSSEVTSLAQGGYQVHIVGTGIDTTMVGWVLLDNFSVSLEKNTAGEVLYYRKTCESTNLQATGTTKGFRHFNPGNGQAYTLSNSLTYSWSADPASEGSFNYSGAKIWIEGDDLPSENTVYTVTATDRFDLSKTDEVTYISIIPKADFDTTFEKKYDDKVSAPVTVTLTNNSVNATKYTWIFGDGDTTYLKEPSKDPDPHIYYTAGKSYKIILIAQSAERCERTDSVTLEVDASDVEIPNFFSPNGDGLNDYFTIYNLSLSRFHICIYSSSGRKVYEYSGNDINHWDGWDGKSNNSDVSPGIYYYVLEAQGFDNPSVQYKPTKYSGFVYLFRD